MNLGAYFISLVHENIRNGLRRRRRNIYFHTGKEQGIKSKPSKTNVNEEPRNKQNQRKVFSREKISTFIHSANENLALPQAPNKLRAGKTESVS